MIRYFTYYSCGGYKDIYVGSDNDSSPASYFIPLLNVWKKNDKPGNAEKIERAESVQHVELITKNNSAGFPSECNLMFSHGGYNAIYRTLHDGKACLCIRDIPNGTKDEEGREIPFNFMFLASGQESIEKLDRFASEYLYKSNEINGLIANAISYDYVINGVKFDLTRLNALLSTNGEDSLALYHQAGTIDYLKITSRNQTALALKEQNIDEKKVKSAWDSNGVFYGNLQYLKKGVKDKIGSLSEQESPDIVKEDYSSSAEDSLEESSTDDSVDQPNLADTKACESHEKKENDEMAKESNVEDTANTPQNNLASEISSIIESKIKQIEQKLSLLAKAEDIGEIHSLLERISTDHSLVFNNISSKLDNLNERSETLTSHPQESIELDLKNKFYLIAGGCLVVGFVLGALIF